MRGAKMRFLLAAVAAPSAIAAAPSFAWAAEKSAERTLPPVEVVTPSDRKPAKSGSAKTASSQNPQAGAGKSGSAQAIAVLVNDDPVTAYEIEQRRGLALMGSNEVGEYIKKNIRARWEKLVKNPALNEEFKALAAKRGVRTKEQVVALQRSFLEGKQKALIEQLQQEARASVKKGGREQAIEDLIDERLKLQEAKRLNVLVPDEEVDKIVAGMAQRNKMTPDQFAAHMKKSGANLESMRERFRAELSWRDVIRRRFGGQVAITERDIDRLVATAPAAASDVAIEVQRITLPVSAQGGQRSIAERMREAETVRGRFAGCKSAADLASAVPGAKLENLGAKKLADIPEPTRSLLREANNEDILPPTMTALGIELWIACGRQAAPADKEKRDAAQAELRQREFELLAKRHLKDLRQDAHIEYR